MASCVVEQGVQDRIRAPCLLKLDSLNLSAATGVSPAKAVNACDSLASY